MVNNGGGGNDNTDLPADKMNLDNDGIALKRVRQYGDKSKGPFIVCIRAIDKPLLSMKITKFLHNTYKSKLITKQINEIKMNVIFSPANENDNNNVNLARHEANLFPKMTCRIYIPERLVEVIGCI